MNRPVASRLVFIALIAVLSLGLVGLTSFVVITQAETIRSQQERIHDLNVQTTVLIDDLTASQVNAQRLYDQLLELGENPEGANPEQIVTTVPGETGARGEAGRPPTANEILGAVGEYCAASGACQGVPGVVGPAGPAGGTGDPGATVIGPAGPQGVQGDPGTQGPEGPTGATGPAGPPCPDGFTQQLVYVSTDPLLYTGSPALACLPNPAPTE